MNNNGNHPVGEWNFFNGPNYHSITISNALNSDEPELLQHVIEEGADVNEDIGNGWTPLHEAFDYAIDGMIQNSKEEPYPEILEMIKILIVNGADLSRKNFDDKTPLDSLNTYSASIDGFNAFKKMFREIIPSIDSLVWFKEKTNSNL